MLNADTIFFHQVSEIPFMDLANNLDKARPAKGSEARIKWLGGDSATGPWVYYIEHPAGAIIKPHKHHAPRIEYVLEGEIEFFLEKDAVSWFRGDENIHGTLHSDGSLSYVPSGTVYAYRITKASKLLHVFFENPVGRTVHIGIDDDTDATESTISQH